MCNCQLLGYWNLTFRRGSLLYGLSPTVSRLKRSVFLLSHITYSDSHNAIKHILRNLRRPSRILSFITQMCGKCFDFERHLCGQYSLKVTNNVLIHEYCVPVSSTGLFKMIVGVLTNCHTQYTWDRSSFFLFNRTTLQISVAFLTGALYMHPLWFYKHQHDNLVRSKLFVASQPWWFQWRFWIVPSFPGYTRTLSLETVHTIFEWNCQMVVVYRIWCGIAAGQLYPDNHFE